jgi:hypothetical protein
MLAELGGLKSAQNQERTEGGGTVGSADGLCSLQSSDSRLAGRWKLVKVGEALDVAAGRTTSIPFVVGIRQRIYADWSLGCSFSAFLAVLLRV